MSSFLQRQRAATVARFTTEAISFTALNSPSLAAGNPASMTSTPRASKASATSSFSLMCMLHPGDCSPSRSVVSKIFILLFAFSLIWFVAFRCFSFAFDIIRIIRRSPRGFDCVPRSVPRCVSARPDHPAGGDVVPVWRLVPPQRGRELIADDDKTRCLLSDFVG